METNPLSKLNPHSTSSSIPHYHLLQSDGTDSASVITIAPERWALKRPVPEFFQKDQSEPANFKKRRIDENPYGYPDFLTLQERERAENGLFRPYTAEEEEAEERRLGVSTKLTLSNPSINFRKNLAGSQQLNRSVPKSFYDRRISQNPGGLGYFFKLLRRMRIDSAMESFSVYTPEQEAEERRLGVSTKLKLWEDIWRIKKTLTGSDVNDLCRLMLGKKVVQEHILDLWDEQRKMGVETEQGVRVSVWDYDTGTEHQLVFKRWRSSGSFVFTDNWTTKFVKRRGLKAGDKMGLFWDTRNTRFGFRILPRAPRRV